MKIYKTNNFKIQTARGMRKRNRNKLIAAAALIGAAAAALSLGSSNKRATKSSKASFVTPVRRPRIRDSPPSARQTPSPSLLQFFNDNPQHMAEFPVGLGVWAVPD